MDLLDILVTALNFTYVISEPRDRNWGQQLANGTWDGMTGMLHRKEADFALTAMSLTADRATVSDHTVGFYFDEIVLMTALPDTILVGWTFCARPFDWLVFILLGCALVACTFVLTVIDKHGGLWRKSGAVHTGQTRHSSYAASLVRAGETLFGSLIGRGVTYQSDSTSANVLLCAWSLMSMVMVATYTGKLTSNSVVTRQPVPFSTLSELVERTDYKWGVSPVTSIGAFMATSQKKDFQLFYQKMLTFARDDPDIMTPDPFTVAPRKVLAENYVRVTTKSLYLRLKKDHCRLTLVKNRLSQDTIVVYLQKNSPYTSLFNDALSRALETGIIDSLTRTWFPESADCYDETKAVPLSLDLLSTAFILAAGGAGLAAIQLVLERLVTSPASRL